MRGLSVIPTCRDPFWPVSSRHGALLVGRTLGRHMPSSLPGEPPHSRPRVKRKVVMDNTHRVDPEALPSQAERHKEGQMTPEGTT